MVLDAEVDEHPKLSRLCDAVAVLVLPHTQLGKAAELGCAEEFAQAIEVLLPLLSRARSPSPPSPMRMSAAAVSFPLASYLTALRASRLISAVG